MARRLRIIRDEGVYHVLNRRVGRLPLFEDDADFEAFEHVLAEACARTPSVGVLAYVLMGNHWHLLLRPARAKDLAGFMQWLTVTHMRRWHAHHGTAGTGPLYQGRFKSFPVQGDDICWPSAGTRTATRCGPGWSRRRSGGGGARCGRGKTSRGRRG